MASALSPPAPSNDKSFFAFNAVVSVVALSFLGWLLLVHRGAAGASTDLSFMPAINASFNALAGVLLVAGYVAIRSGRRALHQRLMVSAFAASGLFLVCYVGYHYLHGDTRFTGEGALRPIYFFILITHVVLSMGVLPMALTSFYLANKQRFAQHKKLNRVLLPIWLYVSVTGVAIFFLLRAHS